MIARLRERLGGAPLYPLFILLGLNTVDELDRTAFAILAPEIRDHFGLGFQGLLTLIALVAAAALALQVVVAGLADRMNRVHLAMIGAALWSVFSFFTGVAGSIVFLGFMRAGSAVGKAVNDPTHNSLLADYYAPEYRPAAFSVHRAGNAIGVILGALAAGFLGFYFSWRLPFIVFAAPTAVFVILAARMVEPVRGGHERRLAGANADAINTAEVPPSYAEAWRLCWKVETLRRIWLAMPFLAASLIGFGALASIYFEDAFGLDERQRGIIAAATEPAALIGLAIGAVVGTRLAAEDPRRMLRWVALAAGTSAILSAAFALAPELWMAIVLNALISLMLAIIGPGLLSTLSLAIPPRARAMGFSMGSLFVLPGLLILPMIGWIADKWGIRTGMLLMTPVFFVGGQILASIGSVIGRDIEQVRKTAAARSEVMVARQRGEAKLLVCRDVEVFYDTVQVLFGVDIDIDEGEIVALLGTNGAGKSTLLKAISGVAEAEKGAILFDGRDITHAPPHQVAGLGIAQLPGGHAVFASLTVRENLRAARWLSPGRAAEDFSVVFDTFPTLERRLDDDAGDLSGGQQQMLALGMALLNKPRLLMIDELTLGLAPTVVDQLLPVVRRLRDEGVTIVLVEQSVNIALTIADRAYFMEKGQIRFEGPAADLLDRPDVLRSVFLQGAARTTNGSDAAPIAYVKPTIADDAPYALRVEGLGRSFGGIKAVDNVQIDVREGEIVGVIGPNGAGKTTMFDLISGLTPAESGTIELAGVDITRFAAHQRARAGLGRSFQDARLFPALTVEDTLAVALERFVGSRDPISAALHLPHVYESEQRVRARVNELIALLELEAFRTKFISELSTGSRRIVDLGCVLAHRPLVVMLDEPSSGIAQRETEALGPVLRRIRDEMGSALLVIEHDMALLSSISDRLVALDQGAVLTSGTPDDVLTHPDVVSSYLGDNGAAIARSGARAT